MTNSDMYKQQCNVPSSDINYLPSAPMYPNVGSQIPVAQPPLPPPPPPYPTSQATHVHMHASPPVIIGQQPIPTQAILLTGTIIPPEIRLIRDYMAWSIVNIFLGGLFLGLIAILLSSQTKKRKLQGDIPGARTMSTITLVFNIIVTIFFFLLTAFLIVYFVFLISILNPSDYSMRYN